jgi:hypothetical protein
MEDCKIGKRQAEKKIWKRLSRASKKISKCNTTLNIFLNTSYLFLPNYSSGFSEGKGNA